MLVNTNLICIFATSLINHFSYGTNRVKIIEQNPEGNWNE